MTWEAIGGVAQALAALGVIASLLYLATQVRQSTTAAAVAAKLASTQLLSDFVDSLTGSPDLMDLLLRGRKDLDGLDTTEYHRFSNMCLKAFWFFSAAHFQLRSRTLGEDDWREFHSVIRFWITGPGVQGWWQKTGRDAFARSFSRFIDGEIARLHAAGHGGTREL